MKPISIFIILVYILLPVVCFAHPAELHVEVFSDVIDTFTSEYPDKKAMDNCEFASCCAEFTPPILLDINSFGTQGLGGQSPYIEPSQVFTPIFAPPQNIA